MCQVCAIAFTHLIRHSLLSRCKTNVDTVSRGRYNLDKAMMPRAMSAREDDTKETAPRAAVDGRGLRDRRAGGNDGGFRHDTDDRIDARATSARRTGAG